MRIVVLGSGIIGLTTALALLEAGCQVEVIADAPPERTTSHLAAGIWFPTHAGPRGLVAAWGRRTYDVFAAEAAAGDVPGVLIRESLMLYRDGLPAEQPDWVASVGAVRPARQGELPPGYAAGLRFAVPLTDMPVYLPWLEAHLRELGVRFTTRHVDSLDELAASLPAPESDCGAGSASVAAIVNCTGLAARDVVKDLEVYPVRGQIIRTTNPGLTLSVRDEHHPDGRAYVHPRTDDCILGGTLDENEWDTRVNPTTADGILARCLQIVPQLRDATVIEHLVGLRPARQAVRLEEGERHPSGIRIIHNYGHGGAGVTLSRGCAEEAAELVLASANG